MYTIILVLEEQMSGSVIPLGWATNKIKLLKIGMWKTRIKMLGKKKTHHTPSCILDYRLSVYGEHGIK